MQDYQKKIKQEYKNRPPEAGVYQIKNLQNNKILVGSSMNLRGAFNSCQFQLKMGVLRNKALQEDYNRLGNEQFSYDVLERLEPQESPDYNYAADLATLEELWLEKLQPFGERGYNKPKK